jgi:hypothetical protein
VLAPHLRYVERHSRKLARSTMGLMGRHQASLEKKGALLGRVVDIGSELYAISCAVVYASSIAKRDPARREEAFELADLFATQATGRAELKFSELFSNDDSASYKAAQKVLDGRYTWWESDVLDPSGDGPMMPHHEESAVRQFAKSEEFMTPPVPAQNEAVQ